MLEGTTVGSSDVDQMGEDDVFTPGKEATLAPVSELYRPGGHLEGL